MELFFTSPRLARGLNQGLSQGLTLLALALGCSATLAQQAEDQLDRVSVQGSSLLHQARTDVRKACPNIDASLGERMAAHIGRIGQEGEMLVVFQVQGDQVSQVQSRGGPSEYRRPLRRAMHGLSCSSDPQASQKYAFIVAFKLDDGSGSGTQSAALQPLSAERLALLNLR